jgi:hypothetical protein
LVSALSNPSLINPDHNVVMTIAFTCPAQT